MRKVLKGLVVFSFFIFAMLLAGATLAVDFVEKGDDVPEGKIFAFVNNDGSYDLWLREAEKEYLENIARSIKKFVYKQATEHNPEGDILPDNVDDGILEELKNKIN